MPSAISVLNGAPVNILLPDLSTPLLERLKHSRAVWDDPRFSSEHFSITRGGGIAPVSSIQFPGPMKLEDIAEWAREEGSEHTVLEELLSVSASCDAFDTLLNLHKPGLMSATPLFALGSICTVKGELYVPYIQGGLGSRKLALYRCAKGWNHMHRILIRGTISR